MLERLFAGSDYDAQADYKRLKSQVDRIFALMKDGNWRTLTEIKDELETRYPLVSFPESSISAQLRNLRKTSGGAHIIEKKRRGKISNGVFEYQLKERQTLFN